MERYPGSDNPSGYRSEVTLYDEANAVTEGHSIFMNNGYISVNKFYETPYNGWSLSSLEQERPHWKDYFSSHTDEKALDNTLKKTLGVSCMFMWIILAALTFGAVFDGLGAGRAIETLFIEKWNLTPWGVLIMMQLSYILMGMFLDDTAMLVIVAPLYVPLIISLGFDPIWYGVLYTITCQIAYMTPPFGYNLFLMRAMAPKEISLQDIYRSIIPFVLIMVIGLAIVMAFPEIATYLPEKYLSR